MIVLMLAALLFCQTAMLWCCFMLIRNHRIHAYLIELLNEVRDAAIIEIHLRSHDAHWRLAAIQEADYNDMLYKFWRPLDSWFPYRDLLTNGNTTEEEYRHARARQFSN
jgi:hypothetical protein